VPLLDDLIRSLKPTSESVSDVSIGGNWTLVAASECGVASRLKSSDSAPEVGRAGLEINREGDRHDLAGQLRGKPARDLLQYAFSRDATEASIGIATANALAAGRCDPGLFRPYRMPRARGKRVAVVGEFRFLDDLRSIAEKTLVIRKNPESGDYDGTDAESLIPEADIALINGSAVVDGTLEHLLGLARPCYTIVHGPSTPLSPVLFEYGADQLVGVMIKDPESARRCIALDTGLLTECRGIQPVVLVRPDRTL
jgi:uncharacterized protein (DUF4213/DUF364 family)